MATKKELLEKLDKIDDEELAHMLALVAYRENQEELDQLLQLEEYTPPDEVEMRTFQEKFHKDSQKALQRSKSRVIRWTCGFAAAAVFAFAVPISADNVTIFELVAQVFTEYSDISTLDGYTFEKPAEWDCEYYPTWIPNDFHFIYISSLNYTYTMYFESSDGKSFLFSYTAGWTYDYSPIEEGMILTDTISLNHQSIPLYSNKNGSTKTIYIHTRDGLITIDGHLSQEQISKVSNNVKNIF